jgi:hypothetical protein
MSDYPNAPGSKGGETSVEAAEAMQPHCGRLQALALDAIREAGEHGLTTDELAARLGIEQRAIQPRTSELRHKSLIGDSGLRRRNDSGKRAIVWVDRAHLRSFEQAA